MGWQEVLPVLPSFSLQMGAALEDDEGLNSVVFLKPEHGMSLPRSCKARNFAFLSFTRFHKRVT